MKPRLVPRSLRGRLVLITSLLATCAVVLCQFAGLTVLRSWLTNEVDDRLAGFRPPPGAYRDIAAGGIPRHPRPDDALPSEYRVFFYGADGRLLLSSLGSGEGPGPRLPRDAADLDPGMAEPTTIGSEDGPGGGQGGGQGDTDWRVIAYPGPDGMSAVVALPLDTVDGATTRLLWFSAALVVAVAAGVVALSSWAVRLGMRPLTRVERTARRITLGALELNVPVHDPDTEVGRLGLALNTMLDQLRAALRRTESSERRMRRFMADAGHELRTPLTAVQGFAELLLDGTGTTDGQRREAHALIVHNADRMSRLVDDLFLLARLGDGPGIPRPHREPVDLLSLAADTIAGAAVRHPDRTITLEPLEPLKPLDPLDPLKSPEPSEPPGRVRGVPPDPAGRGDGLDIVEAPGDPHQLAQVLGNLVANACVHTPAGSRIQIRVGAGRTGDHEDHDRAGPRTGPRTGDRTRIRTGTGPPLPPGLPVCVVEVADDGPGIDPADAPHVFDRFYRGRPRNGCAEPGSGLGLAIAAGIAAAHGGRMELDSHPGRGTVFRLLLPCATEPTGPTAPRGPTAPEDPTAPRASHHRRQPLTSM
ncbi:sensor histidine kinase [Streptomyces tsukubensis]|uniref:sensor histidine kinase n=1 Tax=Streptomyces tsukubensis TaxID=83656 RepID=UPI00344D1FD7